jgi:hypothetical protein
MQSKPTTFGPKADILREAAGMINAVLDTPARQFRAEGVREQA